MERCLSAWSEAGDEEGLARTKPLPAQLRYKNSFMAAESYRRVPDRNTLAFATRHQRLNVKTKSQAKAKAQAKANGGGEARPMDAAERVTLPTAKAQIVATTSALIPIMLMPIVATPIVILNDRGTGDLDDANRDID